MSLFGRDGGLIHDDEEGVVFFVPGTFQVHITPVDGSDPYEAVAEVDEWHGTIDGKPIITIPFEEG